MVHCLASAFRFRPVDVAFAGAPVVTVGEASGAFWDVVATSPSLPPVHTPPQRRLLVLVRVDGLTNRLESTFRVVQIEVESQNLRLVTVLGVKTGIRGRLLDWPGQGPVPGPWCITESRSAVYHLAPLIASALAT